MEPHEFIEGHEKVLALFGQWPSFHDGEVHRLVLDRMRRNTSGSYIPSIEIHLRGWIMTPEVTDAGFYKQEHDSVVHFQFEDVYDLELAGFNHQNVLSCLNLAMVLDQATKTEALHIELEDCYGLSGSFKARKGAILSVVPFVKRA
jgi:hypothetical protein